MNGLSADLEDFVKGERIKSGCRNLDLITNIILLQAAKSLC